jgi:predicted neutral ceramidase superfamily lipid hydrolase
VRRQIALLVGGTLAVWAVLAVAAWFALGRMAVFQSLVAALICLLPTTATLIWGHLANRRSPEQQLALVLGGTGVRMLAVLALGVAAYYVIPDFRAMAFWIWVLVFYLITLTVEMSMLVRRDRA